MNNEWTIMEIIKLAVSFLTPVMVVVLTVLLARFTKKMETAQWAQQRVVDKRLEIYDLIGPLLNELFCFYCLVGNWKEITPDLVIAHKRRLDRLIHVYTPLFSPGFLLSYRNFMGGCFKMWGHFGDDAKIRAPLEKRKKAFAEKWDPAWDEKFAEQDTIEERKVIRLKYQALLTAFSVEIGVLTANPTHPTPTPAEQ